MGVPQTVILTDGKASIVEEQIKRFRRTYRRRLRKLARLADPFADLIVAFPAVAFALVTDHGTPGQRGEAIRFVKEGYPLKRVAQSLGLPYWLRKLPPEGLTAELPDNIPDDPRLSGRFAGLIPSEVSHLPGWLAAVCAASEACDLNFALWVARQHGKLPQDVDAIRLLGVFAWYSDQTGTAAGKLIEQRWNDKMSLQGAARRLEDWLRRLRQDLFLGDEGVDDPWLTPGRAAGYRFVPLLTLSQLEEEGNAMDNCVADYAWKMAHNQCRLFSIRRGATRVATVEIQVHNYHDRIPQIIQLYGPGNDDAPDRVWAAAYTWLGKQASYALPAYGTNDPIPSLASWQRIWRPYWRSFGVTGLLPETPDRESMPRMSTCVDMLQAAAR